MKYIQIVGEVYAFRNIRNNQQIVDWANKNIHLFHLTDPTTAKFSLPTIDNNTMIVSSDDDYREYDIHVLKPIHL